MGCENIQSFTIPGAVFAQIWGEQRDGRVQNGGRDIFGGYFFEKTSGHCNVIY